MRKPNFFIVGAPRCGTASLYSYLKQHPEVWTSVVKEPHFFGSDLTVQPHTVREEDLYLELFAGAGDRPRLGEASVWYLSSERAPLEIHAYAPGAKIIILLRDPVEMAYSLYSLYARTGNDDLPTFEAALAAEPERRQGLRVPPAAYFPEGLLYTDHARYAAQVERYLEVFGRENVHCIVFDDFVRDTAAAYRRTLEFLGVDPAFEAELDPRKASQKVRMLAVRQLRHASPEVKLRLRLEEMKKHDGGPREPLSSETAARLRRLFAADVARLGALLGRDLGAWAPPPAAPAAPAKSGSRLQSVLDSVRLLKKIPPEIRAKHERVETLERKLARWQKVRVPDLPLQQRPYDPEWPAWFAGERERIAAALGRPEALIEHYGSTAVPGLPSKNIIDIAIGLDAPLDLPEIEAALGRIGYTGFGNSPVDPEALWYWRLEDDRAFAVHLGDRSRLWFGDVLDQRDYLRAHPHERDRYSRVKQQLAGEKDQSFLQYTLGKQEILVDMIEKGREWRQSLRQAAHSERKG
jgi:GrpB-like predicted nucleotidyltransferase (UPF0157 family)